jgi:hypothetical protein
MFASAIHDPHIITSDDEREMNWTSGLQEKLHPSRRPDEVRRAESQKVL